MQKKGMFINYVNPFGGWLVLIGNAIYQHEMVIYMQERGFSQIM